jgi:hypothetical protein
VHVVTSLFSSSPALHLLHLIPAGLMTSGTTSQSPGTMMTA